MHAMSSVPTFFISRVGDAGDLTAPLEFFPPKGSDELYEALKQAYPLEANLQARMRQAVIDFLLNERQVEEYAASQISSNTSPSYLQSPESSFTSLSTPATSSSQSTSPKSSAPAPQQQMMDVWSLPTSTQTKIHHRRNMTDEEKKKYKAKRLTGACSDCKQRRRKCTHDNSKEPSPQPAAIKKASKQKKRISAARDMASKSISTVAMAQQIPVAVAQSSAKSHLEPITSPMDDMFTTPLDVDLSFDTNMSSFFDSSLNDDSWANSMDLQSDWTLFPDMPMDTSYNTPAWLDGDFNGFESLQSPRGTQHHNPLLQQSTFVDQSLGLQVSGAYYQHSSQTKLGQQHSHGDSAQGNQLLPLTSQGFDPQVFHGGDGHQNTFAGVRLDQRPHDGSASPMSASSVPSLSTASSLEASPVISEGSAGLGLSHVRNRKRRANARPDANASPNANASRQLEGEIANIAANNVQSISSTSLERLPSSAMTVSQVPFTHTSVIAGQNSPRLPDRHLQCPCHLSSGSTRLSLNAQDIRRHLLEHHRVPELERFGLGQHFVDDARNFARTSRSVSVNVHNDRWNLPVSQQDKVLLRSLTPNAREHLQSLEISWSDKTMIGLIPHAPAVANAMLQLQSMAENGSTKPLGLGSTYASLGQTSRQTYREAQQSFGSSTKQARRSHATGPTSQSYGTPSASHILQHVMAASQASSNMSPKATIAAKTIRFTLESGSASLRKLQPAQALAQSDFRPASFSRINATKAQSSGDTIAVTAVSQLLLLALFVMLVRFMGNEAMKGKGFSSAFSRMQARARKSSSTISELRCIGIE